MVKLIFFNELIWFKKLRTCGKYGVEKAKMLATG
jgi:hypothetical protein